RKARIATPAEAQTLCDNETAVLEYIMSDDKSAAYGDASGHSYCLIIRKNSKTLVPLDGLFDYKKTVADFRTAVIEPNRKRERERLGALLYGKLISPLEKTISGASKIIIVPDGHLAFLPFDALRQNEGAAYLCERYTITLSPSVSVLLMTRERRFSSRKSDLLAFGGAVYSDGEGQGRGRRSGVKRTVGVNTKDFIRTESSRQLPYYDTLSLSWENIPGTLDEVKGIGAVLRAGSDASIYTGKDVTESMVKSLSRSGKLAQYRSVHFACHGYYDADKPAYSAVVLSEVSGSVKTGEDGYLSVPEVAALNFQCDIVTLSACETGLGKIVGGDGVVGLARAFQEAGALRVGVTLWQVADEPTKRFMIALYRKMGSEKIPFSKAMSEIKKEFIRSKEFNDPYFWSSFILYGE
ncbi:MAG TPA: CHAT domain-containing protein, partial [Spirochaetota bacterium]